MSLISDPRSFGKLVVAVFLLAAVIQDSHGQYYFGRNKIQYDDFKWEILKTRHFDVYFYPEMQELAEIGAAFAEEAYRRLEAKLNHNIDRRVPLIFYSNHSHFQQTNTIPNFISEGVGGFFEFIKGRVVIPANGSIPKFKHVINHELVHVFTRSKMNRVLKDHRRTRFGGMPLWFTEGIAEYWSAGWDSQAEMIVRDAVLSGHLVPLSRMDAIYGTFLMYKEGQAICKYIAETFGEEKLLQLIENLWKESRFSDVMKLTIGLDYEEFDKKWLYDLKKEKYPLLEDGDSPKMTSHSITKEGVNTKPACITVDGEDLVVFSSNRVGYSNIYVKSMDSDEEAKVLVKGGRTSDFESFHLLSSKLDVNQRGELAFVSRSGARDVLYIMDVATKRKVKEFDFEELVSLFSPNWSPDDDKVVLTGITYSGRSDLFVVDVEEGQLDRLTNDFYDDRDPAWSPDGRSIAFSSDRAYHGKEGYMNLFVYNLDHDAIRYLTAGRHNDYSPAWSPDGQQLAFSSDRDASFNIWVMQNPAWPSNQIAEREETGGWFATPRESVAENDSSIQILSSQNGHTSENGRDNGGVIDGSDNGSGSTAQSMSQKIARFSEHSTPVDAHVELKKITNYVTGALDPTWRDDNTILFTAFENFSFQIQQIDQLGDRFEEAALSKRDSIQYDRDHWTAEKLIGSVESTSLKYRRRFSLDIAQSAIAQDPIFGVSGGAQLAMSDMLSNQQYYFLIFNNSQTRGEFLKSWNVAVTRVELGKRLNYAFGGYHITGRYFDQVDSYFDRRQLGGFVSASYPISTFRRVEASVNVRDEDLSYATRGKVVNGLVVSNSLSYVKDNSLWGPTGPIDGERFKLTLGHSIDVQHNEMNFYTFIMDYRRYFRLGARTAYALRMMTRLNIGRESFRYFMGGSWDLRLYPRWRTWGRKLFLINHELRFPFIDRFLLGFPFGGMGFNAIRGALFADLGQAWDRDYEFDRVLGSLGLGMRFRLGAFLVLRFEMGRRFYIANGSSPSLHFEEGLKKAFWFGFDF